MTGMRTRAASVGSVLLAAALVAGCGGGGSSSASGAAPATSGPTTAPGAGPTGSPGAGRGFGGQNPQQLAAIRQCLRAAGIPLPSFDPSRRFSPGATPSFSPRPRPTGSGGAGPGGRRLFADPKVQAALKACGITVPTFRPRPSGQGRPPAANASPPAA